MQTGEFDGSGQVFFTATKKKPFDMNRLQSGMFMDRPELWRVEPKRRRRVISPLQGTLFEGEKTK